jgi:hypothetical protein
MAPAAGIADGTSPGAGSSGGGPLASNSNTSTPHSSPRRGMFGRKSAPSSPSRTGGSTTGASSATGSGAASLSADGLDYVYALGAQAPQVEDLGGAVPKTLAFLGPEDEVSVIDCGISELLPVGAVGAGGISCVVWWQSYAGEDFACASVAGTGLLVIVSLARRCVEFSWRCKFPIESFEMAECPRGTFRQLIISATGGDRYLLPLELERPRPHSGHDTVCAAARRPDAKASSDFHVELLPQLSGRTVAVQRGLAKGDSISSYDSESAKLELFDAADLRYPHFVYQLPPRAEHVCVTDRFVFTVTDIQDESPQQQQQQSSQSSQSSQPAHHPRHADTQRRQRVSVISKLIAGTSAVPYAMGSTHHRSLMQEFDLAPGMRVLGIAPLGDRAGDITIGGSSAAYGDDNMGDDDLSDHNLGLRVVCGPDFFFFFFFFLDFFFFFFSPSFFDLLPHTQHTRELLYDIGITH